MLTSSETISNEMRGAQALVQTLGDSGVRVCFANPGTSEMHFVSALDGQTEMRCILGLQENIVTGAADGYWRVARIPAANLLHCGPGLANGIANLHNARRARSGIVNIVGDHASDHVKFDSPLTSDTEGLARTVSAWVRKPSSSADLGDLAAEAVSVARSYPGQIATLVLPADASWSHGGVPAKPVAAVAPQPVAAEKIEGARALLAGSKKALLLLAGEGLRQEAIQNAHRIAAATGCLVMAETSNAVVERGRGRGSVERIAYDASLAMRELAGIDALILVGSRPPVSFFRYPHLRSEVYPPGIPIYELTSITEHHNAALEELCSAMGLPKQVPASYRPFVREANAQAIGAKLSHVIAQELVENAIIVDESVSVGRDFFAGTHSAAPHEWLQLTGGAIGAGMPMSIGAAVAGEGRRVVNLQGDGSALYTVQSLWTQAHESLPVTTIILSNRRYNILINEYKNVGAEPGEQAMKLFDISGPEVDWVALANSFGVEAKRTASLEELAVLLRESQKRESPFLIEFVIT